MNSILDTNRIIKELMQTEMIKMDDEFEGELLAIVMNDN